MKTAIILCAVLACVAIVMAYPNPEEQVALKTAHGDSESSEEWDAFQTFADAKGAAAGGKASGKADKGVKAKPKSNEGKKDKNPKPAAG